MREELYRLRRSEDEFRYELVVVPSFTDAVTAVLFNYTIQSCIIRQRFGHRSQQDLSAIGLALDEEQLIEEGDDETGHHRAQALARRLHDLRPELDLS